MTHATFNRAAALVAAALAVALGGCALSQDDKPASTQAALQRAENLDRQREILRGLRYHAAPLASRAA